VSTLWMFLYIARISRSQPPAQSPCCTCYFCFVSTCQTGQQQLVMEPQNLGRLQRGRRSKSQRRMRPRASWCIEIKSRFQDRKV
ncbi:hypothetical protein B0O99DRAFT_607936, partial [Bisporella sp. PMI_857]